jgi:hypothetical protein
MTLGQAPGGAEFIGHLMHAVQTLGLLYANSPDSRALVHLETYVSSIEGSLVEAVGANKAPIILSALRGAVMGRKHEIESGGPASGTPH